MLSKNNSIVLSKLKYGDHDLIIKCYTKQRGIVTYLLKGILKSKKSQSKTIYYQALSQLEIEENYRSNKSLQYIKDVRFSYMYKTLHNNVYKSAIVIFLSEVLSIVLKEEEPNKALFQYITAALQYLDTEDQFSNFHLLFLLKLTRYLGFKPGDDTSLPYFNLQSGIFEPISSDKYSIQGENLTLLKLFLGINFDDLNTIKINSKQRQAFLQLLLFYFELHLGNFKKPKSLQILNEVFN